MNPPAAVDDGMLTLDEQVCFAMVVATRSLLGVYRPVLQPLGLTHPQYLVMLALWQHQPVSVAGLGDLLALDPATLSPLLKRLEAMGLLQRRRAADDERRLEVTTTAAGIRLREQALQVPPAVVERLGMTADELGALRSLLGRVITAATGGADGAAGERQDHRPGGDERRTT